MATKREKPDKLSRTMNGIKGSKLKASLTKDARIEMRVSTPEKAEIGKAAKACNLTVTEYLTRLHRIASERMGRKA